MMTIASHKWPKHFLVASVFWMALVLTPRVLVRSESSAAASTQVPVRTLENPDNCLWCNPQPQKCKPHHARSHMWLNPDDPLPQNNSGNCLDKKVKTRPSA